MGDAAGETVRVWLVARTYSDDEQNLRKERALTSFTGAARETTAAVDVDPGNLGSVDDDALREQYAAEARRMKEDHDPSDTI
jgi:hypothetical protein